MRKLLSIIAVLSLSLTFFAACSDDDEDTIVYDLADYQEWRAQNDAWVTEMQQRKNPDGTPYYTTVIPSWDPGIFVLMHYFNDRAETEGNLTPLSNSTVDVRYNGYTCEGEGFDSSTYVNRYGKLGIARFSCNQVITGWTAAMEQMRVGDTVEIIVPYKAAYGTQYTSALKPYSSLRFNIRLEDIYRYEAPNK